MRRDRVLFCGSGSAWVAQLVERVLGKDEVTGSIPVPGSSFAALPWMQGARRSREEREGFAVGRG